MSFSADARANSVPPNLLAGFDGPHRGRERRWEREGRKTERKGREKAPTPI